MQHITHAQFVEQQVTLRAISDRHAGLMTAHARGEITDELFTSLMLLVNASLGAWERKYAPPAEGEDFIATPIELEVESAAVVDVDESGSDESEDVVATDRELGIDEVSVDANEFASVAEPVADAFVGEVFDASISELTACVDPGTSETEAVDEVQVVSSAPVVIHGLGVVARRSGYRASWTSEAFSTVGAFVFPFAFARVGAIDDRFTFRRLLFDVNDGFDLLYPDSHRREAGTIHLPVSARRDSVVVLPLELLGPGVSPSEFLRGFGVAEDGSRGIRDRLLQARFEVYRDTRHPMYPFSPFPRGYCWLNYFDPQIWRVLADQYPPTVTIFTIFHAAYVHHGFVGGGRIMTASGHVVKAPASLHRAYLDYFLWAMMANVRSAMLLIGLLNLFTPWSVSWTVATYVVGFFRVFYGF